MPQLVFITAIAGPRPAITGDRALPPSKAKQRSYIVRSEASAAIGVVVFAAFDANLLER